MKLILQIIAGALAGFVGAYLFMSTTVIDFLAYSDTIVGIIYIIVFTLLIIAFILSRQIHNLNRTKYEGEEEDEIEEMKYKKFTDHSLLLQISTVLAVLGTSVTASSTMNIVFIVTGIALIIICYTLQTTMLNLLRKVYPERNLPRVSDSNYEEKLLEISDEGERHVMLHGFYKAYGLLNVILIFAIVAATIYSISSDNSQIFSIFLMSIVLILTNARYALTIRNK